MGKSNVNIEIDVNDKINAESINLGIDRVQIACDAVENLSEMSEVKDINVKVGENTIHIDFKISRLTNYMYPGIDENTAETIQQFVSKGFKVTAKAIIKGWI